MNTGAGDMFSKCAEKAKEIAQQQNVTVEFDFNDVLCLVDKDTYIPNLERYYHDAHIMDWKTIGPKYEWDYDADTEIELCSRRLKRATDRKASEAKQQEEDSKQNAEVNGLIEGIELEIIEGKEKEYADYVAKNSGDGYSKCCVDYGEAWAKLMQVEITKGKSVKECAEETQKPLGYIGITGFMYGCVVQALAHFWQHGEELRKWHNKEYGVSEDKAGVVNPAVLTIST